MSDVFNAIKGFFNYIRTFIDVIFTLIKKVIVLIGIASNYIKLILHALPAWIWIFLAILLAVCILYKVLGKEQ